VATGDELLTARRDVLALAELLENVSFVERDPTADEVV
jgi:hypothetical protein